MVAVLRPRKVARKNETAIQRQQRLLHQHIPPNWGRQRGAGLRTQGMPNWNRVLCYRHSGLQAFLHVPKFVNWLEQEHMAADCAIDNCLACALRDLCEVYWLENPPPAISQKTAIRKALERIDKLAHLLRWYDEDRRPNQHQDAEEYFRWILTTIADQLPPVASSTLSSLFIIHVDSTIKCRQRKCNHHSTTPDTQLNLQTNIPPPPTNKKQAPRLTDYITSSLHETITDLRCSSCSNTATKPRIYTLTSAPPILILQQKRFSINPQNGTTSKLTHRVTFSEWLDLTSHSPSSSTSPREQILYRLTSVVSHAGSLTHGHYKTVAKGPDHKWSEINDDFVRGKVGFKEVVEPGKWGKMDWTPYLLFYERVESVVVDG
ncbi:MAG: hypothetical protein M1812_005279 [Candelaria pacifica]|nr:MAG: hypothetical protein M1812_005279 [Candelaria pacifica]